MISKKEKVYGLLGLSMKAGKVVFGTESCIDMINKRKIKDGNIPSFNLL